MRTSGFVSIGFIGLQSYITSTLISCSGEKKPAVADVASSLIDGYGPLQQDPKGIINLPPGFSYKIIAQRGEKMSDGLFHPGAPDGMATFPGSNGRIILIRNHELMPNHFGPYGKKCELLTEEIRQQLYDPANRSSMAQGGTTTLIINEETLELEKSFLSLGGTLRNCAGGPTPWNSWISCEEVVTKAGDQGMQKNHGYTFEVPATEEIKLADPVPIKAMGRFNHEAVCVDPRTGIVYQTEDRGDSCLYRFIPNVPGELRKGGKLQALALLNLSSKDTRNWKKQTFPINEPVDVTWIDLDNIDAPDDDLRHRAYVKGAARFARGEGIWFGDNEFYFACTSGGANGKGQVFRYSPSQDEGTDQENDNPGKLELFAEPNNIELIQKCDNLTIAPWGDVILCEDNPQPFVVGITPQGKYYKLANNVGFESEFAGGVFSPSGKTFFVNIQYPGVTLAIQGPWDQPLVG